jgi:hypothetical protein
MGKLLLPLALAASGVAALSPITRVAELLQNLSKQVEEDGKAEEKLFLKYRCWFEKTKEEKAASNAEAEARIETLSQFIDDVENGRIEFTTERIDLEKQLATINSQLEKAKNLREQEEADYDAAHKELTQGITALDSAIQGLVDATAGSDGAFLARKFDVRRALLISSNALSKEDYQFVEKALDRQPEKKDWEKLNKKGEWKESYGKRSGGIQKTLNDLLTQFKDNRKSAEDKEEAAIESYMKLKAAKEEERDSTKQALTDMAQEGAARGLNLEDAKSERSALRGQVDTDTAFVNEATTTYESKLSAYKIRKQTRTDELAAISSAIGILRSDDARDLFKSSFESQVGLFIQKSSSTTLSALRVAEAAVAKNGHLGRFHRIMRKASAVARFGQSETIAKVITSIDKMIKTLQDEREADLKTKTECEDKFRSMMTEMKRLSMKIDDEQEKIENAEQEIATAEEKIAECEESIAGEKKKQAEAVAIREDENAAYIKAKGDDTAAAELVQKAKDVLEKFYQQRNAAGLLQTRSSQAPKFLDAEYNGEQNEAGSITEMLQQIKEDIEKDIKEADEEEAESKADHDAFISASEAKVTELDNEITNQEGVKADAIQDKGDAISVKKTTHESLADEKTKYRAEEGKCNFYMLNFEERAATRLTEMDGLRKAKTILAGGEQ